MFGKNARRLSIDGFEPVVQLVEGLHVLAAAEGELPIVAKFQKEALCELLHRLLQRAEKLAVSKMLAGVPSSKVLVIRDSVT